MQIKKQALGFEIKSIDDSSGDFTAYVSVFNNVDFGGDIVDPFAFDDEILNNPNKLYPLLHSHNSSRPIGGFTITKNSYGLLMTGQFCLDVQDGKEAYYLAKKGVMTGFSIGYSVDEAEALSNGARLLKKLKLYEGSIVVFPMNDQARLTGIKAIETEREFEKLLRDVGFSRNEAKAITAKGFKAINDREDQATDKADVKENVKINSLVKKIEDFMKNV